MVVDQQDAGRAFAQREAEDLPWVHHSAVPATDGDQVLAALPVSSVQQHDVEVLLGFVDQPRCEGLIDLVGAVQRSFQGPLGCVEPLGQIQDGLDGLGLSRTDAGQGQQLGPGQVLQAPAGYSPERLARGTEGIDPEPGQVGPDVIRLHGLPVRIGVVVRALTVLLLALADVQGAVDRQGVELDVQRAVAVDEGDSHLGPAVLLPAGLGDGIDVEHGSGHGELLDGWGHSARLKDNKASDCQRREMMPRSASHGGIVVAVYSDGQVVESYVTGLDGAAWRALEIRGVYSEVLLHTQ